MGMEKEPEHIDVGWLITIGIAYFWFCLPLQIHFFAPNFFFPGMSIFFLLSPYLALYPEVLAQ